MESDTWNPTPSIAGQPTTFVASLTGTPPSGTRDYRWKFKWCTINTTCPHGVDAYTTAYTFPAQDDANSVMLQVWINNDYRGVTLPVPVKTAAFTVNIVPSAGCTVTAGDGGVDAIEPDGIVCSGGMAVTDPLCREQFKNADLATLKVVPDSGFIFTGWTVNGAEITTASANTLFLSAMPVLAGKAVQIPNGGTCRANCSKVTINAPTTVKRDEIFDVTLTLDPPPLTTWNQPTVTFDLDGQKTENLPGRGEVQMYDFGYDRDGNGDIDPGQTSYTFNPLVDGGTKTIKAVHNVYHQQVPPYRIVVLASVGGYTFASEPITMTYQVRQYTTKYNNATVNDFDVLIAYWIDYWQHWHYPDEQNPYTFHTADFDDDLIKAICYKESTMQETDLMTIGANNGEAIHIMQGPHQYPYDLNWSATPDESGKYAMESPASTTPPINAAAVFMHYPDVNANTQSESIRWGIRWLYSKRTGFDVDKTTIPWKVYNLVWRSWEDTLELYGDGTSEYVPDVMNLVFSGENPHPGDPQYLWPILTNRYPRN